MRLSIVLIAAIPFLSACETSSRFAGNPFGTSERVAPPPPRAAASPRIETAPSARVETAPLAPPPGASSAPQIVTDPLPQPESAEKLSGGATPPQTPQVATRTEPPRAPEPDTSAPTRNSVTGNWNVREAAGACRVTLSSTTKLDLYGASTSGCQSRDLQRVTAWELRGDEVYLYEPGGGVAARLKARGRSMDGTLARTGAPVSLSK